MMTHGKTPTRARGFPWLVLLAATGLTFVAAIAALLIVALHA
jgi:hypothetical protein